MQIDGKRMVVTGAASGIGRALLQQLAAYDVQLVAADIDEFRLQEAVAAIAKPDGQILPFTCNLSLPHDVDDLFQFALDRMGGVDIFFANAGFGYYEHIERPDWGHIEEIYRTNVFSPIYAVEKMQEMHRDSPFHVVITGSVLGRVALEGYALYASTKAALDRFVEGYRLEKRQNGRLSIAYPLPVRTGFFRAAGNAPIPQLSQSADKVATAIIRGVERDKETIYTSPLLPPMLLIDRLLPPARRLYQRLDSRTFQR